LTSLTLSEQLALSDEKFEKAVCDVGVYGGLFGMIFGFIRIAIEMLTGGGVSGYLLRKGTKAYQAKINKVKYIKTKIRKIKQFNQLRHYKRYKRFSVMIRN